MSAPHNSEEAFHQQSVLPALYGPRIQDLINDLILPHGISLLSVRHRVKTFPSASAKLAANPSKYGSFTALHDFLGLRVITYLASEVDEVVGHLKSAFEVDDSRSIDKQASIDPDRFGYVSYHLVAKISADRAALPEWKAADGFYFEIQVRSVLQHAWAEIEHDLGYKSVTGIPPHLRRRFARLAGLLELADAEFDALTGDVAAHVKEIEKGLAIGDPVPLDHDSIIALTTGDGPIGRADRAIAAATGAQLEEEISDNAADARLNELEDVGYRDTRAVEEAVGRNFDALVKFASGWLNIPEPVGLRSPSAGDDGLYSTLSPGVSLFYLYLHESIEDDDAISSLGAIYDDQGRAEFRAVHDLAFGEK